jgi:hypothetical protein
LLGCLDDIKVCHSGMALMLWWFLEFSSFPFTLVYNLSGDCVMKKYLVLVLLSLSALFLNQAQAVELSYKVKHDKVKSGYSNTYVVMIHCGGGKNHAIGLSYTYETPVKGVTYYITSSLKDKTTFYLEFNSVEDAVFTLCKIKDLPNNEWP